MPEVKQSAACSRAWPKPRASRSSSSLAIPEDSFMLERFQIETRQRPCTTVFPARLRGTPILLGSAAAEVMDKSVGDTLRITSTTYRIVGIYETGDAFEDSAALLRLEDAQELLGKERQVSLFYIRLKDTTLRARLEARVAR